MQYYNLLVKSAILALSLNSISALAGQGTGNGGSGFVCRNPDKSVRSAFVLDLFEGIGKHRLDILESNESVEKQLESVVSSLSYDSGLQQDVVRALKFVGAHLRPLAAGVKMPLTSHDIHPEAFPADDCYQLEQIATFDNDDVISYDPEIYSALTLTGKSALRLHEAIYLLNRSSNQHPTDGSLSSRRITALMFAQGNQSATLSPMTRDNLYPKGNHSFVVRLSQSTPLPPVALHLKDAGGVCAFQLTIYNRNNTNEGNTFYTASGCSTDYMLPYNAEALAFRAVLIDFSAAPPYPPAVVEFRSWLSQGVSSIPATLSDQSATVGYGQKTAGMVVYYFR